MIGYEVDETLKTMQIIVDTREKPTEMAKRRWEAFGLPYKRKALNVGDYSAEFTLPNGKTFTLADSVVFERKMNIDELAMCFGTERSRFTREFERAKANRTRVYLLTENATWEKIIGHKYKSRLDPRALVGSIITFTARYDCIPVFCDNLTTSQLIAETLKKEAKERLKYYEVE